MRIVMPVHHFPPRYTAGSELYALRLSKKLIELGHEVEVVTIESIDADVPGGISADMEPHDGVPAWRLRFNLLEASEREVWNFDNPLLEEWFSRYLAQDPPDVVHFQSGYLIGVSPLHVVQRLGIPSVLTLHDFWFLCPRHTLMRSDGELCDQVPADPSVCAWCVHSDNRRTQLLNKLALGSWETIQRTLLLRQATAVQEQRRAALAEAIQIPQVLLAPSHYLTTRMREIAGEKPITPWAFGMNETKEEMQAAHAESPSDANGAPTDNAMQVGYLGQVSQHKGVKLLVEAWRKLQGTRPRTLHIYGGVSSDQFAQELRAAAQGDPSIHLHGRYAASERKQILAGLDAVVVPSIWYENRPATIEESLAAGVPVLTARLGGMAEMVQDGIDGLLFPSRDVDGLAHTLQRLLDEDGLLAVLRTGAHTYVPRRLNDEAQALLAIYQQAIRDQSMQVVQAV